MQRVQLHNEKKRLPEEPSKFNWAQNASESETRRWRIAGLKNKRKQDKVNNADSVFIFLTILLICRNGKIGQVGQYGQGA